MVPGGVRGARLHHGLGLEGLPGHRRGLRDRAARGAARSPSSSRSRSSPPPPRPRWATTTRTWTSTARPRSWATAPLLEELRRLSIALYTLRGRARARARDHPGRHQVRVRPPPRRDDRAGRRGAHARTRPASGRPTATSPGRASRASTSSTCATGPRLGLGQDAAGAAAARRRGRRHARALRGGLRADRRRAVQRLARAGCGVKARGADPPQGGHPRPPGPGRGAGAARARLRGRGERAHRPAGGARGGGHRPRARDVRAPAGQPADRGLRGAGGANEVRRRPLPRQLRRGRRPAGLPPLRRRRAALARRPRPQRASTPSSSPAASPTATTCAAARSRASRP